MSVTIVLDTNAVFADPALRGAGVGRLLAMTRRGLVNLVIPQVVLDELRRQRRQAISNQMRVLEVMPSKAADALKQLGVSASDLSVTLPVVPTLNQELLLAAYTEEVKGRLNDNGVTIAPLPDETVADLYARDIAARKPFDAKGKGFRDALIWATVVRVCRDFDPDDTVYLVTDDHNFGTEGIAPELLSEIPSGGAKLAHAPNLDDLLERSELSESRLAMQQVVDSLGEAPTETAWALAERGVASAIGELAHRTLDENEQSQLNVPDELYSVSINEMSDLREFSWNAYDEFDNTTVLGQASVTADLRLEGTCDADDVEDLEWYEDEFEVSTEDDIHYVVSMERPATLFFDVRIELSSESADQVDFEGFQPA